MRGEVFDDWIKKAIATVLALAFVVVGFLGGSYSRAANTPSSVARVAFVKSDITTMRAGVSHTFDLTVLDSSGTPVTPSKIVWSLEPGSDNIGHFEGSVFVPTTVGKGRVHAEVDGVVAISPAFRVMPGQLAEILLSISAGQVVGHPLVGTAKLVLLDQYNNLKTDYNLAAEPISLMSDLGVLNPSVINDTLLFDSGVVDFLPVGVTYTGLSNRVSITATNGVVTSNTVIVSFNGYDLNAVTDFRGQPVSIIYSGLPTSVTAYVSNGGDRIAATRPQINSYFRSGGGSANKSFEPHDQGQVDSIPINLPTDNLASGADTLVLQLKSFYQIGDSLLGVTSYLYTPVTVVASASVDIVNGSTTPGSVYAGVSFGMGFSVQTQGLVEPVDSATLTATIVDSVGGASLATIFSGLVTPTTSNGTINYSGIPALIPNGNTVSPGTYLYKLDYRLYSGGNVFVVPSRFPGSLTVVAPSDISYQTGSLRPDSIAAGDGVQFTFNLVLGGDSPVQVDAGSTSFRIFGAGFSTSSALTIGNNQLAPGVNQIVTGNLFIPPNQEGNNLQDSVTLLYRQNGVANQLSFTTNFGGKTIFVRPKAHVKIVSVVSLAPNVTHVDTGQNFQIRCAFTSTADAGNVGVHLITDGGSIFQGDRILDFIAANETTFVSFNVKAAATPDQAEVFQFDFTTQNVIRETPVNNLVVLSIERPANLTLSLTLLGAVNNVVPNRAGFGLNIQLANQGEALATPGVFRLSTGGVPLGIPDPTTDTIDVPSAVNFSLIAPAKDTSLTLSFVLIQRPLDRNTGLPAVINDTSFSISVYVTSLDARLVVEPQAVGSGVTAPGIERDLFSLKLSKGGVSTISDVAVTSVEVTVTDFNDQPVDARDIFVVGNTGMFEAGRKISSTTAGGSVLKFGFENLIVSSSEAREIVLHAKFQKNLPHGIRLSVTSDQIQAMFSNGPVAGQPLAVVGPDNLSFKFAVPFEINGVTMSSSLVVKDNPYNPDNGPSEFRFLATDPSGVRFTVYTLDGQEVYEHEYPSEPGVVSGDPFAGIYWNGRNGSGDVVRNGVYLIVLTGLKNHEQATLKLAVVR